MHFSLDVLHSPLSEQMILRGPEMGVNPRLQFSTTVAPGL